MSDPNYFKETVEIAYYISGIAVAFGVGFAIRQYYVFKADIKTKYDREISSCTSDQLRAFYQTVIPAYESIKRDLKNEPFSINPKIKKIDWSNAELKSSAISYLASVEVVISDAMKRLASEIQVISVNFAYGSADTDLAGKSIADLYIKIFEFASPIVLTSDNPEMFKESLNLYNQWTLKKRKQDNDNERKLIESDEHEIKPFFPKR